MASTFLGLSIAQRGLTASQAGLSVTTNNMSNINTTGYSRQVVSQTSIGPAAVYSSSQVGGGADVTSVDRVRSFRLDQKYWQANGSSGNWEAQSTYLSQVEEIFGSTDTSYISSAYDEFTSALETLSTDVSDTSVRATVLEAANSFCSTLNDTASQLEQLRSDINDDVYTTVNQINSYTTQLADLNEKIALANAAGASTNELEDQQGVLMDELSALVDIDVTQGDNGAMTISVAGCTLVSGNQSNQLECYTVTDTTSDQYGMYGIRWSGTSNEFDAGDSGALSGYLTMRDGSTSDSKGVVYYMDQLDSFARSFAEAFNEGVTTSSGTTYNGQADGVGLDGTTTGIRFFSYDGASSSDLVTNGYSSITAANISVSSDIQNDTSLIAAASSSGGEENGENLTDILSICEDVNISDNATVTDLYSSIIATVGTQSEYAQTQYSRKDTLVSYIDNSRSSVSGVSSDEETINLTKYQSAYEASASMVSTWSEIYSTTINMVDD